MHIRIKGTVFMYCVCVCVELSYLVKQPKAKLYNTAENWSKIPKEICNHNTRVKAVHCNTYK